MACHGTAMARMACHGLPYVLRIASYVLRIASYVLRIASHVQCIASVACVAMHGVSCVYVPCIASVAMCGVSCALDDTMIRSIPLYV